jgi:hypothetical protein
MILKPWKISPSLNGDTGQPPDFSINNLLANVKATARNPALVAFDNSRKS